MMWIIVGIVFILGFLAYILWDNGNPILEKYNFSVSGRNRITNDKFENKKQVVIYQISDLHNDLFGPNQERLTKLIKDDADFIFITGDIIDRKSKDIINAEKLITALVSKFSGKVFFVSGNHEKGSPLLSKLYEMLSSNGVKILRDETIEYENINIIGLEDPSEYITINKMKPKNLYKDVEQNLKNKAVESKFNILLSHRPEFMEIYVKEKMDLVFSGHAHGGQVKLFGQGVLASGQGFFPKYDGGLYHQGRTTMINSRGLGNNYFFTKRVFNTPHVIKVILDFEI